MTTEETELTFIRCPSCRSLVPAVATRCRMCGYSFESAGEAASEQDDQEASKARSRVRQRTISATREQMEGMGGGSMDPAQFDDAPAEQEAAAQPEQEGEAANVLESFSAAILGGESPSKEEASSSSGIAVDEPQLFDQEQSPERTPFIEPPEEDDEDVIESVEAFEDMLEDEPPAQQAAPEEPAFEEPAEDFAATVEADTADEEQGDDDAGADEDEDDDDDDDAAEQQATEGKSTGRKRRRRRRKRRGGSDVSEQTEQQAGRQPAVNGASAKTKTPPEMTGEAGLLVGWLVEFADNAKGTSTELRSGRFFMGRQQLRKHDMVIDRDGISTPHCLVLVDQGQICVQDLMSERGTYIKRLGASKFEEVSDVAEIGHGDTLKIGEYEVIICLMPS